MHNYIWKHFERWLNDRKLYTWTVVKFKTCSVGPLTLHFDKSALDAIKSTKLIPLPNELLLVFVKGLWTLCCKTFIKIVEKTELILFTKKLVNVCWLEILYKLSGTVLYLQVHTVWVLVSQTHILNNSRLKMQCAWCWYVQLVPFTYKLLCEWGIIHWPCLTLLHHSCYNVVTATNFTPACAVTNRYNSISLSLNKPSICKRGTCMLNCLVS